MRTLIKNVKIILEEGVIQNHGLIINDDKIEKIIYLDDETEIHVDEIIDGNNQYLSPGFIDIHNHGNTGYDTMDATPEALENIATYHLKNGVTSFLATTVTNPQDKLEEAIDNVVDYMQEQSPRDPIATLEGIYFEGPYFNVKKKGAQPESAILNPDIKQLQHYIERAQDTIKVVAYAPELPGASAMTEYLNSVSVISAIAHTDASYEQTQQGIEKGMHIATHLYNGMRGFTHRDPGVVGAVLNDARVYGELIVDGVHLHKGAVDLALNAKGVDRLILISDAMEAAGLQDGTYDVGGQAVEVKNGEARLENGSLAGSTLNLNEAVKNVINDNDVRIEDAVKMAATNPAKAIGLSDSIGSIKEGKRADLILFDETITINKIFKYGRVMTIN